MARYSQDTRIDFTGDPALCRQFISEARKYLGGLSASHSVPTSSRRITNSDGVVFTVQMINGRPRARIDTRGYQRNVGDYKTVVYYFDYAENILRGINVDTGNEDLAITGLTGIGAMAAHPREDQLFFSHVSTSTGVFYNVVLDIGRLALYTRGAPPAINTAQRPDKRARQPGVFVLSPDAKHAVAHYRLVTNADGVTGFDGYGGYFVYSTRRSLDLEDRWPLFELQGGFIERGMHKAAAYDVQGAVITTDNELIIPANNDTGGAANTLTTSTVTRYNRIYRYRATDAPVEAGFVTYATGAPPGGFWLGGQCRKLIANGRRVYALFDRAGLSYAPSDIAPFTHGNLEILALPDAASDDGLVALRGENIDLSEFGASDPRGPCVNMALSPGGRFVYITRGDNGIAIAETGDTAGEPARNVMLDYEGAGLLTQLGRQYCDLGPRREEPDSLDQRLFVSVMDGGENRLLICRPGRLDRAENGATISPFRFVRLPGLPYDKQYNIALRRVKRGFT